MMRKGLITFRVNSKEKKEVKELARRKGFKTISAFLWSLIHQAKIAIFLISLIGILGCATVSFLPATNFQSLSPSQSVEIFYDKPDKAYITLGKIIVESGDISENSLYKRLRQKAMNIGADAIIIKSTQPAGTDWLGTITHRIEGLAIRWKE